MSSDSLATAAEGIAARLRTAEQQCRDRYVNPHREAATLPVIRELAEVVAALAQRIPTTSEYQKQEK